MALGARVALRLTPQKLAENRRAQRRHRLGRHTRNPASTSHGRLRLGVDLFGRASRGLYRKPKIPITTNLEFFLIRPLLFHLAHDKRFKGDHNGEYTVLN